MKTQAPRLLNSQLGEVGAIRPIDASMYEQATINNRLLWLQLCTLSPLACGQFQPEFSGDQLDIIYGNYSRITRNNLANPVGVAVYCRFVTTGVQVKLATDNNSNDSGVVDYLGSTPVLPCGGKIISNTVVLNPGESLYIAYVKDDPIPIFPLPVVVIPAVIGDKFVVRVFDPAAYMIDQNWETR
jgi:hypothetical protein